LKEQFVIGVVRGVRGLLGEVKIESTSGEYEHFFSLKKAILRKNKVENDNIIEYVLKRGTALCMKVSGIDSPEDAKKICGCEIIVPRTQAAQLKTDEYYIEDIKGCELFYRQLQKDEKDTAQLVKAAKIVDVIDGGSGKFLEVILATKRRKIFIPFRAEFIGQVDIEKQKIELLHWRVLA
jgi:16S rRNA processing protein RimM